MLVTFGFIVIVFNIISKIGGKQLKNRTNLQKFGALYSLTQYSTLKGRARIPQFYIIIFLLQRLLYSLLILFAYKSPKLQQILNILVHTITFLITIIIRPYSIKQMIGAMVYFFDFVGLIIFATLPLYLTPNANADRIGIVHIFLLVGVFVVAWIAIMVSNIYQIYRKYYPKKRKRIRIRRRSRGRIDQLPGGDEGRRIARERLKEVGKKHLKEEEEARAKQREVEWRRLQNNNYKEYIEAKRTFNGPVPLYVERGIEERIRAHKKKWEKL